MTNADAILMSGAKIHHKVTQGNAKGQRNYYSQQHQQQQQQQQRRNEQPGEEEDDVFEDYLDTRSEGSYAIAGDFNGKIVWYSTKTEIFESSLVSGVRLLHMIYYYSLIARNKH